MCGCLGGDGGWRGQSAARARIFGRDYGNPFYEEYMTEDADVVLVGMGTLSNPVRVAIRQMREEGKKVGFVRDPSGILVELAQN